MASQQAPLVTNVTGRSNFYSRRRYRGTRSVAERPKPEVFGRKDPASACIDLTGYGEMNDDTEELLVSPLSDDKAQIRSLSNCENEATVAVENIKNLLERSQSEREIPKGEGANEPSVETSTREALHSPSKMNDREPPPPSKLPVREELWIPELSQPSEEDQSISVYEMTKARLARARRNRSAQRFPSSDIEQLTRKHEQLVQKSSEFKNNASALIEIIHIENDQVVPSLRDVAPNHNRVNMSGRDLLSSMVYEIEEDDNGKPTNIIVIEDILEKGKNEISSPRTIKRGEYEDIRTTRSGRLIFEKTNVHPLSSVLPEGNTELRKETKDFTLQSLSSIRDQVKVLQQWKMVDEPIEQKSGKNLHHVKSENEEMDTTGSLIVCTSSRSLESSADSVNLAKNLARAGKERNENSTAINVVGDAELIYAERPLRAEANFRKSRATGNDIVDMNDTKNDEQAISVTQRILTSEYLADFTKIVGNEKYLESAKSRPDAISGTVTTGQGETEKPFVHTKEGSVGSKLVPQDPLSTGITASDLCIGFCSKKGDDSVALLETPKAISPSDAGEHEMNDHSFVDENSHNKLSTCTDQTSRDSTNRVRDDTSLMNENFVDRRAHDQESEPKYNRDLAISAEHSSSSYPSDVEIDDEANPAEEFQRNTTIVLHSMAGDSGGVAAKPKNVQIVLPMSSFKKGVDASTSDNGSTVTDNSDTRVSLGDSENTDSDLDDEAGLYDTCFARQLLDATCGWLDKDDMPFCIQPSLLKKVKRRDVGSRGQHYGRSPLLLRIPRTNIDSRRKLAENVFFRSRRNATKEAFDRKDHHQRFARSRRNQNIFGSSTSNAKDIPIKTKKSKDAMLNDVETQFNVNDPKNVLETNEAPKSSMQVNIHAGHMAEEDEMVRKNIGIFEVKSAEECKSYIPSNVERALRSRSLSPTTIKAGSVEKPSLIFSNVASNTIVLESKAARNAADKNDENEVYEARVHSRNASSPREGLAKLRRYHPERVEVLQLQHEESGLEPKAIGRVDEDQRYVALELAEKLRRRAITLKRRRQIRERRREFRCADSELVLSPVADPLVKNLEPASSIVNP